MKYSIRFYLDNDWFPDVEVPKEIQPVRHFLRWDVRSGGHDWLEKIDKVEKENPKRKRFTGVYPI